MRTQQKIVCLIFASFFLVETVLSGTLPMQDQRHDSIFIPNNKETILAMKAYKYLADVLEVLIKMHGDRIIRTLMDNIVIHRIEPITNSGYIKPLRCHYSQDGKTKSWDLLRSHDSVATLLYHKTKDSLVFVRQFRPAVFVNNIISMDADIANASLNSCPTSSGFTLELCAGIIDKNKSPIEIAKEEIHEECGFDVPLDKIEFIAKCRGSAGISGTEQTMYFAEIDENMRSGDGCGIESEDEMIEVIYKPISECRQILFDANANKSPGLMFAVLWFLTTKYTKCSE